jgi:hypothetical protein
VRNPYIQSLTLALTRQVGSSLTVDVRYIGTLSRKQVASINLNEANWLNNGLKEALDLARAGGESELLNQMIPSGALWLDFAALENWDFSSFLWSGSEQVRQHWATGPALATGNYEEVAAVLGTENGWAGAPAGVQGKLLRSSDFPENFIFTNRQFAAGGLFGGGADWITNLNHTNYHSLQGQVTLRPTHGLNFQASYTWSRNLGMNSITDPLNRALDYGILPNHRSHMLTTYGTYNLPLGPNGYLFRSSSSWVKKLVEGWQLSWISSLTSGVPASVTTVESMWSNGMPDLVRPDLFDTKGGHVTWESGSRSGRFYGNMYKSVPDPQCNGVSNVDNEPFTPGIQSLQTNCQENLLALALASDPSVIVFQKPLPGERGNFDMNQIMGPGRWGLDLAMSKSIEFMEGKSINFRVDVHNIFNHPTPSNWTGSYDQRTYQITNPNFNLNHDTEPFGYIGYKTDHRVFSAKVRITF